MHSPIGGFSCFLDTFLFVFFSKVFREISLNRTCLIISVTTLQAVGLPTKESPSLDVAPRLGVSVPSCRAAAERVPVPVLAPVDRLDPTEPPAEVWMALNQPLWFLPLLCFEQALKFSLSVTCFFLFCLFCLFFIFPHRAGFQSRVGPRRGAIGGDGPARRSETPARRRPPRSSCTPLESYFLFICTSSQTHHFDSSTNVSSTHSPYFPVYFRIDSYPPLSCLDLCVL